MLCHNIFKISASKGLKYLKIFHPPLPQRRCQQAEIRHTLNRAVTRGGTTGRPTDLRHRQHHKWGQICGWQLKMHCLCTTGSVVLKGYHLVFFIIHFHPTTKHLLFVNTNWEDKTVWIYLYFILLNVSLFISSSNWHLIFEGKNSWD